MMKVLEDMRVRELCLGNSMRELHFGIDQWVKGPCHPVDMKVCKAACWGEMNRP